MNWCALGSAVPGISHISSGIECQDCFVAEPYQLENGEEVFIVAVADGAGSAKFAREGATFVCQAFCDEVKESLRATERFSEALNPEFGRMFVEYCREQMLPTAESRGVEVREFASTFLGCVLSSSESVFFQLGDGGIVYSPMDNRENYSMAIPTIQSEYANVTQFVTDTAAVDTLRFAHLNLELARVAIFTDGLQNLAVDYQADDHGIPFPGFFNPMFQPITTSAVVENLDKQLDIFLASDTINQRTDDDKTLVLVVRI